MKAKTTYLLIQAVLLLMLLNCLSCSRYCAKRFPTSSKDSISYIEKVKFDTIKMTMPADTTVLLLPVDCPDQVIESENSKQKIRIVFKDRILTGQFICKEDSLKNIISTLETQSKIVKEKVIEKQVKFVPWWVKPLIIALGVIILYLVLSRYGVITIIKNLFK